MNRSIKLSEAITYIVAVIAILAMVIVWPLKLVHRSVTSMSNEVFETESGECSEEHMIAQVFVAKGTELESVNLYICSDSVGEEVELTLYDGTLQRVYDKTLTIDEEQELPGLVEIPVSFYTERGAAYILSVSGVNNPITVGLENHATTTNGDVFSITYDGVEDPDHNIIIRYNYYIELSFVQIILVDISIIVIAILIIIITRYVLIKKNKDREIIVQKIFQFTLNPAVIAITIVFLWLVFPGKLFSDNVVNIIFWDAGILIASVLALYEVNYKRRTDKPLITLDYIKENSQGWIIAIAIAHMLWYCFEYMNGFYDIHHTYAVRRVLTWFIFALISTFEKKEFIKIYNLVWLVIGGPLVYIYAKPYIGSGEQELEYILNAHIIYFGIFLIMNMIYNIILVIRRKVTYAKVSLLFVVPYAILLAGACILANTREWPGFLTLLVVLLVFRLGVWKNRDRWLEYLCNGVILNFLFMMAFSLLHRPYYGYIYHRYNMSYFTVTMTATHLTLCLAACLVKLYEKNRKCEDKRELIPWLILLGIVGNYELFTLSRTGYASVFAMFILFMVLVVVVECRRGKRLYTFFAYCISMIVAVLVLFAPTSTFTRILPVLYDDPVIYEYEPCIVTAYKGTSPDYRHYMDLPRFIEVFNSKVLGIGDATASVDDIVVPMWDNQFSVGVEYASINPVIGTVLYLSYDEDIDIEESEDVTNGRTDIYRCYIDQLNLWGHDTMGAILKDGSEAAHAHNVLLQVMYDHGIVYGIYFAVFMAFAFIVSVVRYVKDKEYNYQLFNVALLTGFAVAGIVEWIYHSCNPFGLTMILAVSSLVYRRKVDD